MTSEQDEAYRNEEIVQYSKDEVRSSKLCKSFHEATLLLKECSATDLPTKTIKLDTTTPAERTWFVSIVDEREESTACR
jgi:hypothetical protein